MVTRWIDRIRAFLVPVGNRDLPGVGHQLVRATRIACAVCAGTVVVISSMRVIQGATDPLRSLIVNSTIVALLLACLASCRASWAPRNADALVFALMTILNGALMFSNWQSHEPVQFFMYMSLITPLALAAFAPVRPIVIFGVAAEVSILYPASLWLAPQPGAIDPAVALCVAFALGVLGAAATQGQRNVLADLHGARSDAQKAARLKNEFLANVSHEIRTPMTGVLGFAEELHLSLESSATKEQEELFTAIERNGQQLLALIHDILDLAKVESNQLDLERAICSPLELVRDVGRTLEPEASAKGLELRITPDPGLPAAVRTDATRLRQVLLNLGRNSIKFTERGHVRIGARVEPGQREGHARLILEVDDTGIGIDPKLLEQLFEPFQQGDASNRRRFGGAGLGLTLSRHVARALGGELRAQSVVGEGSTFFLDVPVTVAAGAMPDPGAARTEISALKGRILLAEDGPDNQRLITRILERAGLEVEVAVNGLEALEKGLAAREAGATYDVILMDMSMPEMDGYDATRKLRLAGYTAPILALTAHAMPGDREKCLAAGCDEYLTKPIHRQTLLGALAGSLPKPDEDA